MRPYLARYPLGSLAVLAMAIPFGAWLLGSVWGRMVPRPVSGLSALGPALDAFRHSYWAVSFGWFLACSFAVGLARRRSGHRIRWLLMAPLLCPMVVAVETVLLVVLREAVLQGRCGEVFQAVIHDSWGQVTIAGGMIAMLLAGVIGLSAACVLATWLLHAGKWETICRLRS